MAKANFLFAGLSPGKFLIRSKLPVFSREDYCSSKMSDSNGIRFESEQENYDNHNRQ
jgi:hypothetical protein